MFRKSRLLWLALLLSLCPVHGARGDEFYYLIMFGSQRDRPQPKFSHTFATFVKATGQGPTLDSYQLEAHTVSWLPANLDVRPWAVFPECGRNLALDQTIRWALSTHQHVSMWGPYRIQPGLYCRAIKQIALLESGQVRYKAVDSFHDSNKVSNCIHAVASVDQRHRLRVISPEWGETASWYVLKRMEPWLVEGDKVYPCIASRLGLDGFPLIHRPLQNPRTGLIWRTIQTLSGQR